MRDVIFQSLNERQKELDCLYAVLELLHDEKASFGHVFRSIVKIIPKGWQYPSVCVVRIRFEDKLFLSEEFIETEWSQQANLVVDNNVVGQIEVFYTQFIRELHNSQFLPQEQKLLNTIAANMSNFIFFKRLGHTVDFLKEQTQISVVGKSAGKILTQSQDEHWKWRLSMAKSMAEHMDKEMFGIINLYLIGSTKQAKAGPASDIDFIVHVKDKNVNTQLIEKWFEGWGLCLDEINYQRTGYSTKRSLVDLHIITDEDIAKKDSFASMIDAIDSPAMKLI